MILSHRLIGDYFQFNKSVKDDDLSFKGLLRFFTDGVLGDRHFLSNGFRLTGGLFYNGNHLAVKATPSSNHYFNGRLYAPQQIREAKGTLKFKSIAPYLVLVLTPVIKNKQILDLVLIYYPVIGINLTYKF